MAGLSASGKTLSIAWGPAKLARVRRMKCKSCAREGDNELVPFVVDMKPNGKAPPTYSVKMLWPCPNCGVHHKEDGSLWQPSGDANG